MEAKKRQTDERIRNRTKMIVNFFLSEFMTFDLHLGIGVNTKFGS